MTDTDPRKNLYRGGTGPSYDHMMGKENILSRKQDMQIPTADVLDAIAPPPMGIQEQNRHKGWYDEYDKTNPDTEGY